MKLLITNFEDELRRLAESATEIKVLIAFLTEEGLRWLPEDKRSCSDFIVGIDLSITTPGALQILESGGAKVRVFQEPGRLFHPKAIYLKNENSEHLIVGSNNLTASGISSNHELATQSERYSESEESFVAFLRYFESLKKHPGCFVPGTNFYASYRSSRLRDKLAARLETQEFVPDTKAPGPGFVIDPDATSSFGAFLRELAREFPRLDRRQGQQIRSHPLKVAHDEEFRPVFDEIVKRASQGRLEAKARLNMGGRWFRTPNLFAFDVAREPWEKTETTGRVGLQIHFPESQERYESSFFSIVLTFVAPRTNRAGSMPENVARRHDKLLEHLRSYAPDARLDEPGFKHWDLEGNRMLWSKPLLTYAYEIQSLPPDQKLVDDLTKLANALNGAMAIS